MTYDGIRKLFTLGNLQKETSCRTAVAYNRPLPSDFKALTCYLVLYVFISPGQIVCALEQDDGARKQRLAFKLEQVVALMTLES